MKMEVLDFVPLIFWFILQLLNILCLFLQQLFHNQVWQWHYRMNWVALYFISLQPFLLKKIHLSAAPGLTELCHTGGNVTLNESCTQRSIGSPVCNATYGYFAPKKRSWLVEYVCVCAGRKEKLVKREFRYQDATRCVCKLERYVPHPIRWWKMHVGSGDRVQWNEREWDIVVVEKIRWFDTGDDEVQMPNCWICDMIKQNQSEVGNIDFEI